MSLASRSSFVKSPFARPFFIPCFNYRRQAQAARGEEGEAGLLQLVFSDQVRSIRNVAKDTVCEIVTVDKCDYYVPVSAATLRQLFEHHGYQSYGVEDILAFEERQKNQQALLSSRPRGPL